MAFDQSTKTEAIDSIIEAALTIEDSSKFQPLPVKTEVVANDEALPAVPALPTLPSTLIEQAVTPKAETTADVEIPANKPKIESVNEDSFLDDWFSDAVFVQ